MSIQSELSRISENVSAAFTAIAEKGVVVPANSKSDALAGLIGAIEVGSGSQALTKAERYSGGDALTSVMYANVLISAFAIWPR